ncbi:MAG TPA: PSD1 and planctomycete cytochrome C domain-containing protein [Bryobacteraceae bacterium]
MTKRLVLASVICLSAIIFNRGVTPLNAQTPVSFSKDIQPILEQNCWNCHGPSMQSSRLNLSTLEGALRGGARGSAIVPGQAEDSRLYRMIAGLDKPAMPLGGNKLTDAQIATIKNWIDQGAHWDAGAAAAKVPADATHAFVDLEKVQLPPGARDYWAFKLPVQEPVPAVAQMFSNPIDRFLEKARQEKGLKAAPKADRLTLLRRAYVDLIGLPPSPEEIDAFMNDTAPGAWERVIDKLLASSHYGERWGRHWLDAARYADTSGYENDTDQPNMWRYRDYVVKSFNDDKPYNTFLMEQIAGDEIPNRTDDSLIATGFLRAGPRVRNHEHANPARRYDYLDDVLGAIGKGMLGLTVQCARCHDHKFDPITQKDYYSMEASIFGYVEVEYPLGPREQADAYMRKITEIGEKTADLKDQIDEINKPYHDKLALEEIRKKYPPDVVRAVEKPESERTPGEKLIAIQVLESGYSNRSAAAVDKIMSSEDAAKKKALNDQIAALNAEMPATPPMASIVTDGDWRSVGLGYGDRNEGACPKCELEYVGAGKFLELGPGKANYKVPPSYFLLRGDPDSKAYPTKPGFISVITQGNPPTELPPADGRTSGRRLALAEWLISRDNPLPARVIVNRIWQGHFGKGIVPTLDNFGKMGEQPTNQALLDWLAVEFMNKGWSIKQMQRLIMTSEAYQMASEVNDAASAKIDPAKIDTDDTYLWRYRIQRLDGEIIRDNILSVAGSIDLTMGGPAIFPHVDESFIKSLFRGIYRNQEDSPDVWRRSIYIYAKRTLPNPMLQVFDLPDMSQSFGARYVSTVPTQALQLMNDDFVLRQAQLFADRLKKEAGNDVAKQVDLAYRIALTRPPTERERSLATDMIQSGSLVDFTNVMLNLSEFLYTR